MTIPSPRTVLLGTLNGGLLILLGLIGYFGEQRVHEPDSLAVHALEEPDLALLNSPTTPRVDVASIRDQAVFHSRRSFFEPAPPAHVVPIPDYELAGTMDLPQGKRIAFVRKQSDRSSRTLHLGEELEGWQVERIEASRVVLARSGQQVELLGAVAPLSGSVPGASAPPVAQSGVRLLGIPDSNRSRADAMSPEPRTFQPPPH